MGGFHRLHADLEQFGRVIRDIDRLHHRARGFGLAFHHLPLPTGAPAEAKRAQERQVEQLVNEHEVDLVVLARYMQILSPRACEYFAGRAINIHHSFLPSFKGAKPYHQAHARGVKLIGATCHYVTADLDAGPIIERRSSACSISTHRTTSSASAATASGLRWPRASAITFTTARLSTVTGRLCFRIERLGNVASVCDRR